MEQMIGLKEGACEAIACKIVPNSNTGQSSLDFPSNVKKKEAVKCEHFSIRGYVADIRKRDLELCWPFSPPDKIEGLDKQLADVLPPLHTPKFRYWDCQKCVQKIDASNIAADVSSIVLETICLGRKNAANTSININGSENCPISHSSKKENGTTTMPDIGQEAVDLNLEACASFGSDGTNHGITANAEPKKAKNSQNLKKANVIGFGRRKFRPCESSDDEDEDKNKFNGQHIADQLADPSQITKSKRTQKIRLLNDILRDENSSVCEKMFNSESGINSGIVVMEIGQTKAPHQHDSLRLCDRTDIGNGIEEMNKKRKAVQDEDRDSLNLNLSKISTKSCFYQKEKEGNGIKYSDGLNSNGESHLFENGERRKVSQNHNDEEETPSENGHQQREINYWHGFANAGRDNHKIMGKKRGFEHVEEPIAHRGLEQNHFMSAKQKNAHQIHVGASPLRPECLPLFCNSEKKNQSEASRKENNDRANKMGESESLDDVSLEIVELLAKSRHERRCQEAQNADKINSSISEKTVYVKDSENISWVFGKNSENIPKTCNEKQMQYLDNNGFLASSSSHMKNFGGTQFVAAATGNKLGDQFCRWDGDQLLNKNPVSNWQCERFNPNHQMSSHPTDMQESNHVSNQPCACTQKKIGNLEKPIVSSDRYANKYMPATELLQLMDAGMCPKIPQPDKSIQLPVSQIINYSKEQLSLNTNNGKDHSNLNVSRYSSGPNIYPVVSPDQRRENSILNNRNKKSLKMVSETVKSAETNSRSTLEMDCVLKKPSCGNEDLGKKYDPFSANVTPPKLEPLSLEHCLTYDSVGTLQRMYGNLGIEKCSMNRNPANFSIPGPGNQFMIGSREYKISRRGRLRKSA